jgi:hypothetical protein
MRSATLRRGFALGLAALGLAAAAEAWRRIPIGTADDPGPGLVPLVLALAVAALGVATALTPGWPSATSLERGRVFTMMVVLVVWVIVLPHLGFTLTTVAALLLLGRAHGGVMGWALGAFAVLTAGGAAVLFRVVLAIPLPRGPWGW